ncbi:MAG: hypothetical protein GYB33_07670 [Gammaproteobacteria bacterium]|nr:hypothetical protein [Gammaproteobacteria bacterium]
MAGMCFLDMRLSRFGFYIAIFALLAFTSQSFAVVKVPCEQMVHQSTVLVMAGTMEMDHIGHAELNDADTSGCCSQENCSQMDCISASVAVISTLSPFSVQFSQTLNTEYSVSFLTQEASSLFRPPIFR